MQEFLQEPYSKERPQEISILVKILATLPLIIGYIVYRILYSQKVEFCYIDTLHELTHPINRWMADGAWGVVLAIGQVITDGWLISLTAVWCIFVKNYRVVATFALFFIIRAAFLNIERFPFPDEVVWKSPGIPTLMVPYGHTRDFFYSGHTGSLCTVVLQLITLKLHIIAVLAGICAIYMMSMLIVSRVHFTIDVTAAIIYILYCYQFVTRYLKYIDHFASFPYDAALWLYGKCKPEKTVRQGTSMLQEDK